MHCPGKENPADLPSRGVSVEELMNNHLWFNGPSWLLDGAIVTHRFEEDSVPEECIAEMKVSDKHKHQAMHALLAIGNVSTIVKCENFSSLTRLLRVTGYVLKFIDVLKTRITKPDETPSMSLSAKDISVAEAFWIKSSQQPLLDDERFQTWKMQFGMYYDKTGLWRCGGRLENADLAGCETHPILLQESHAWRCQGYTHRASIAILDNQRKVFCEKVASPVCGMQEDRWETLFPCPTTSITRLSSCPITTICIHWPGLCWTSLP